MRNCLFIPIDLNGIVLKYYKGEVLYAFKLILYSTGYCDLRTWHQKYAGRHFYASFLSQKSCEGRGRKADGQTRRSWHDYNRYFGYYLLDFTFGDAENNP